MRITLIILIILSLVILLFIVIKNNSLKKEIEQSKKDLLIKVANKKIEQRQASDSVGKNVLSNVEFAANAIGCFFGVCSAGTRTVGVITNKIK